jgi:hypothetical protein
LALSAFLISRSEPGAAEAWLAEHDPEGVAFEYQVSDQREQKWPPSQRWLGREVLTNNAPRRQLQKHGRSQRAPTGTTFIPEPLTAVHQQPEPIVMINRQQPEPRTLTPAEREASKVFVAREAVKR